MQNYQLIKISEVADRLGLCYNTILKHIKNGQLQTIKFCDRYYVTKEEFDRFYLIDLFGKVIEQNSQNMISLIQEYKSGDDNDIYISSTYRCNSRYAYNYNF